MSQNGKINFFAMRHKASKFWSFWQESIAAPGVRLEPGSVDQSLSAGAPRERPPSFYFDDGP